MKKVDWNDIAAIFIAVFSATIIKHFLFTEKIIEYNIWIDCLVYMVFFLPIYLLVRHLLNKKKK